MSASVPQQKIDCKNLHSYLRTLPVATLDKLYRHPATCLAVFRDMPEMAKHCVMRILFVEQPVPQAVVSLWVNNKHNEEQKHASKALTDLRVWYEHQMPGGMIGWILNQTFRQNLKIALLGGGSPWNGGGPLPADKHAKDLAFLENYAMERWECVLKYMVGTNEGSEGVSPDVVDVLLHASLMKGDVNDPELSITPGGFQFLLMDTASQIWYFMLQYLETVEERSMDLTECLCFLFQLSFSTLGKDYSTEGLTEGQLKFVQHLRGIGLIHQRKRKAQRYYPTHLAINMASAKVTGDAHRPGYLVVETNYRVYAYTDSPLQVALVALFCEMLYRFPNMAVGNLTRVSVRGALTRGITAEQIINFLRSHAHPQMLSKMPVIPPTISDTIRLWEMERDRIKFDEGVLYNQFLSENDFELLSDYAKDLGVLIWSNGVKRAMIVTRSGHEEVRRFWKRQRQGNT